MTNNVFLTRVIITRANVGMFYGDLNSWGKNLQKNSNYDIPTLFCLEIDIRKIMTDCSNKNNVLPYSLGGLKT